MRTIATSSISKSRAVTRVIKQFQQPHSTHGREVFIFSEKRLQIPKTLHHLIEYHLVFDFSCIAVPVLVFLSNLAAGLGENIVFQYLENISRTLSSKCFPTFSIAYDKHIKKCRESKNQLPATRFD